MIPKVNQQTSPPMINTRNKYGRFRKSGLAPLTRFPKIINAAGRPEVVRRINPVVSAMPPGTITFITRVEA